MILFLTLGLILGSTIIHGLIRTENRARNSGDDIVLFQISLYTNTAVLALLALVGTIWLVGIFFWSPALEIVAWVQPWYWIGLIFPGFNVLSGIYSTLDFATYSRGKFGTSKPDYQGWDEYQRQASNPTSSSTVIINNGSWWPYPLTKKASLFDRKSGSNRSTSSTSGSHRSSDGSAAFRSSMAVLPIPLPSSPSKSSSSSHRSGGKSGDGIGKAVSNLGEGAIVLVAIAAVIALFCAYFYGSFKLLDKLSDMADEAYIIG